MASIGRLWDGQVAFIVKSSHIAADLYRGRRDICDLVGGCQDRPLPNGSLSGKWTISWTLLSASAPILWTGIETGFSIAGIFSSDTSPIPAFSEGHYLLARRDLLLLDVDHICDLPEVIHLCHH